MKTDAELDEFMKEGRALLCGVKSELNKLMAAKSEYELTEDDITKNKWQRVIDEGFLCSFWNNGDVLKVTSILEHIRYDTLPNSHKAEGVFSYNNCEVLREKGIKQPYFQGDVVPDMDKSMLVYFNDESSDYYDKGEDFVIKWSNVIAFIDV